MASLPCKKCTASLFGRVLGSFLCFECNFFAALSSMLALSDQWVQAELLVCSNLLLPVSTIQSASASFKKNRCTLCRHTKPQKCGTVQCSLARLVYTKQLLSKLFTANTLMMVPSPLLGENQRNLCHCKTQSTLTQTEVFSQ